jgi:hypothetical protein
MLTADKQELRGVSRFDRSERRAARVRARELAERWARDLLAIADGERRDEQAKLDAVWQRLTSNDPETVMTAVTNSFKASRAPADIVLVEGAEAGLTVGGPTEADVPALKPTVTSAGNRTVTTLNKTERASLFAQVVASRVLLAAKQTFAAAPGVQSVRAVVSHNGPILACRIERARLHVADFSQPAWQIVERIDPEMRVKTRGRARELQPPCCLMSIPPRRLGRCLI